MLARYEDITAKIDMEPLWYDENGVPRYMTFTPELSPDIYAQEVILLAIACQHCHKPFLVEMSWSHHQIIFDRHSESFTTRVRKWNESDVKGWGPIHYGDPPIHDCTGDTMNCDDIKIIEFWKRDLTDWKRKAMNEINLEEGGEK